MTLCIPIIPKCSKQRLRAIIRRACRKPDFSGAKFVKHRVKYGKDGYLYIQCRTKRVAIQPFVVYLLCDKAFCQHRQNVRKLIGHFYGDRIGPDWEKEVYLDYNFDAEIAKKNEKRKAIENAANR